MKYSCNVIRDLLPLYHDDVCSDDTKVIIEEHLSECKECQNYYKMLLESDSIGTQSFDADHEKRKASFVKSMKRKIIWKQIIAGVLSVTLLVVLIISGISVLSHTEQIVEYNDNISVHMMDDDLISRIKGNNHSQVQIKRVTQYVNDHDEDYLFFCVYQTRWDSLITNDNVFSEVLLCPSDKGVDSVSRVYYYTGDYTGLENMDITELQNIIDDSVLLWSN